MTCVSLGVPNFTAVNKIVVVIIIIILVLVVVVVVVVVAAAAVMVVVVLVLLVSLFIDHWQLKKFKLSFVKSYLVPQMTER